MTEAIRHGYTLAKSCNPNDPKNTRGFVTYAEGTGHIRYRLADKGWISRERNGYETTERADHAIAVVIAAGDAWTGTSEPGKLPSTRNRRGVMTLDAILANTGQRTLEMPFPGFEPREYEETQTWLLLHFFHKETQEIRLELSLPTGISKSGFINTWGPRHPLPAFPFESDGDWKMDDAPEPPPTAPYEPEVTPKTGPQ